MSQNIALDALIEKREKLVTERETMLTQLNNQISEIESSIELLAGKPYTEYLADFKFDDETPDYIRSSQEEI